MESKALRSFIKNISVILMMSGVISSSATEQKKSIEVRGYRSAHFGSTADIVERSIKKDFPTAEIESKTDDAKGTLTKIINVDRLTPFNAPAKIVYRFGYSSKVLIQVDVIWNVEQVVGANAPSFEQALLALIDDFSSKPWRADGITKSFFIGTPIPEQPYQFLFFRGISDGGRMIALLGEPVYAKSNAPGKPMGADVSKVKTIFASYQLDAMKPDLKTLQ